MKTRWIVIADAARARIVRAQGIGPFHDVEQLVHGESRQRSGALASDRAGRAFDSRGNGRHAMEPDTDPAEHEAAKFASEIAGRINRGRIEDAFDELILVAPPRFLGRLRKSLDESCERLVAATVDRELTTASDEEIRTRLAEYL